MEEFPLGSTTWVVAADQAGRYAGLVSVTDAHLSVSNGEDPGASIETLLRYRDDVLLPAMNIKHAADLFERSESDALAVLDDPLHRHVVGMLTEAMCCAAIRKSWKRHAASLPAKNGSARRERAA